MQASPKTYSHLWSLPVTPDLSNALATPNPPESRGRAPLTAGRTPSSSGLWWGGGEQKGSHRQAPSAGNPGPPNLEPEVAASCSAPLREGGNPALLGKRGVDFGPLHAWVWVGSVTPRGGVTDASQPKTLPTGFLASVLWGGGECQIRLLSSLGSWRLESLFQLSAGRRGLQDPRVGGPEDSGAGNPGFWVPAAGRPALP